jgi:hypothetical protein
MRDVLWKVLLSICILVNGISAYAQVKAYRQFNKVDVKKEQGKFGIYADKNWVVPPVYDKIELIDYTYLLNDEERAVYHYLCYKDAVVDAYLPFTLNQIVQDMPLRDTASLRNLYALPSTVFPFALNGKYGWHYYSTTIQPIYDSLQAYQENIVAVYKDGNMGLLSPNGKDVIPLGNYSGFGPYWEFRTPTYRKDALTGKQFQGLYFSSQAEIPPIYDTIFEAPFTYVFNGRDESYITIGLLPDGSAHGYVGAYVLTDIQRVPDSLFALFWIDYQAEQMAEKLLAEKQQQYEADRTNWLSDLYFLGNNGSMGVFNDRGQTILPITATGIEIGIMYFDPDGLDTLYTGLTTDGSEMIEVYYLGKYYVWQHYYSDIWGLSLSTPIMLELNPYNSMSADYQFYFNIELTHEFDYHQSIYLPGASCPVCDGAGVKPDGYDVVSSTIVYDRIVKDGTTTITRKNYLANERVASDGSVYVPTYEQTYDNYKTVQEEVTTNTYIDKYKPCPLCNGARVYRSGIVLWDEIRQEYVLTSLTF